jgi:hypothetical protein
MNWYKSAKYEDMAGVELCQLHEIEKNKILENVELEGRNLTEEEQRQIKYIDDVILRNNCDNNLNEENQEKNDIEILISKAIKEFPLTNDINEAGYLLPSGEMLDFSGKKEGGTPGDRAYDHRLITNIDDMLRGGTDGMIDFMKLTGAIRMSRYRGMSIDIIKKMTDEQISIIMRNSSNIDYMAIDVNNLNGDTVWYKEIDMPRMYAVKEILEEANTMVQN